MEIAYPRRWPAYDQGCIIHWTAANKETLAKWKLLRGAPFRDAEIQCVPWADFELAAQNMGGADSFIRKAVYATGQASAPAEVVRRAESVRTHHANLES